MLPFILFLIFLTFSIKVNAQCTPEEIAILDSYPSPSVTGQVCNANGTITFTENSALVYSIDNCVIFVSNPVFTNLLPANYPTCVTFINNTLCTNGWLTVVNAFIPLTEPDLVIVNAGCLNNWTITINPTNYIGSLLYSIDNGVTFQYDNNVFTGYTNFNYVIVLAYPSAPQCPFTFQNGTLSLPYGCPSPANCTSDGIYVPSPIEYEYQCMCKPKSDFDNFCGQNCYMDGTIPAYITLAGQICDKRYIKLYDGPCCYDCKYCFGIS